MRTRQLLQRHPIPMTCHFDHCLVVTWALPAPALRPLVPPGLDLDTYDGNWGFVVIALVQTRNLRPAFLPAWTGLDYALTGYRIFVKHRDRAGRTRRGLHILRSDTDKRSMKIGGNLLTHYRYRLADIDIAPGTDQLEARIRTPRAEADLHVVARLAGPPAPLPGTSPFRSDHDARRFAGPLPWTFDYEPATRSIVMIRGRRSQWQPRQVAVDVRTCGFLEQAPFDAAGSRLASAFHIADLDYGWDRGVRVPAGQP
ncbi:MAG TPA: DUF2071 domain-containing protein [Streptosporangiaceae bacterium]|nr:DUF2071 domain-containing protein [Streptosporangiaceae bacterium]